MRMTTLLALLATCASGPAWSQSEEEITKALGSELTSYAQCLKKQAHDIAKSSNEDEDLVVNQAISACEDKRTALAIAAQKSSLGWSADRADDEIAAMVRAIRAKMIETVKAARS